MAFPGRGSAGLLLLVVAVLAAADVASATQYQVGGEANWTVPSATNGPNFYEVWVANRTFKFGDELVFSYSPAAHDVYLVNSTAYTACDIADEPIQKWASGEDVIELTRDNTPNYYFICGFPRHCAVGQKFHVAVTGYASTPPAGTNETSPSSPSGTDSPLSIPVAGVILSIAMVCVTTLLL